MTLSSEVDKMFCHIFIQWISDQNLLDEWMEATIHWQTIILGNDITELVSPHHYDIVDLFEWDDDWANINEGWNFFHDTRRHKIEQMMNK